MDLHNYILVLLRIRDVNHKKLVVQCKCKINIIVYSNEYIF